METKLKRLYQSRGQRGASAVEYGLLVAAIAALICVIAFGLGRVVKESLFENTCQVMADNSTTSATCS